MNYGRAIRVFGMPDAPGLDWREDGEDIVETVGGSQAEDEMSENLAKMQVSAEEELDSQDTDCLVKSVLEPDEQWALFKPNKFMPDAVNLAAQYAVLVAAKQKRLAAERDAEQEKEKSAAAEEEKGLATKGAVISAYESEVFVKKPAVKEPIPEEPQEESVEGPLTKEPLFESSVGVHGFPGETGAVPGPDPATATSSPPAEPEGWPEVEDLTFAGFTNWIKACKDLQKKFGSETCTPWDKARQARKALLEQRIAAWSKSEAAESLESDIVDPDPWSFYDLEESLAIVDSRALGHLGQSKRKGKAKK